VRTEEGVSMRSGVQGLIGETALVTKTIHGKHQPGTVRLRGEEWFAIPLDPDLDIEEGSDVVVADIDRGLLVVYPADGA
jgi:membrane protein implicated in regulation of membrane protease activity